MENAVVTENLVKHFGRVRAVDGVSLRVKKGEIYGFLGLNGAGKTTTIRMLLGMIKPTAGAAWINDHPVRSGATSLWNSVGYLVETPHAYPDLSVQENLELLRRLRFISDRSSVDRVIEMFHLTEYRDRPARTLSLGNAQRLGLAKALIHRPEILILDEPANGLDPAGIVEIRELLISLAGRSGATIFISSHILGEISRFASRIGIIHKGKLVREESAAELDSSRLRRLEIVSRDNINAARALARRGYAAIVEDGNIVSVSGRDALSAPDKVASALVESGCPPLRLQIVEEDLESYFLRVLGGDGGAA